MIFALADERTRQGFAHVKPVADQLLEKVQEMAGRSAMLTGLTTGFTELDTMTSGLQPSDLIIVAARPSMGKTAFVSDAGAERGDTVGGGGGDLLAGDVEGVAGDAHALLGGARGRAPFSQRLPVARRVGAARGRAGNAGRGEDFYRRHAGHLGAGDAREGAASGGRAEAARPDHRRLPATDVGLVAPLGVAPAGGVADFARAEGAGEGVERAARRALAALARARGPHATTARNSPTCARAAPSSRTQIVVAFIYREEQYNRTEENAGIAEIIVAKQRNGPTGTVKLAFLKEFTRFENMWRE